MSSTRVALPSIALVLSASDQAPVHRGPPVLESRADVSPRLINSADPLDSFNAVHSGGANDAVIDIPHQLEEEYMDLVESIGDEPVNRNAILAELKVYTLRLL
ncbi:hypothetical protein D9619_012154 [Psilocybe cf. subviscida]|uniref:Uncharacterized protein n=1 Tax=Psilocybe cf. subviscida TaxID=2480587 RepID=A0A8H5B7V2_9AGAR|nr:hypothetical protein D9619_012154 [Psilocybe cf. subviscida]